MNIADKIKEIRKANNLSQEELGKELNVTRQAVSSWENSKTFPDLEIIIQISDKYKISLDILLKDNIKKVKEIDKKIKREKKYKKILITLPIVLIIIFIISYFAYKEYCLDIYNIERFQIDEKINWKENLKVKSEIKLQDSKEKYDNYLEYENIKIKNDFKNIELVIEPTKEIPISFKSWKIKDENNTSIASISLGTTQSLTEYLTNELTIFDNTSSYENFPIN